MNHLNSFQLFPYMNPQNYGFSFNNIQIKDDLFIKEGKNQQGIDKIQKETQFYLYITNNKIPFSIPRYIDSTTTSLTIEYLKNTSTLTHHINPTNIDHFYHKIIIIYYTYINGVHTTQDTILVSKNNLNTTRTNLY